MKAERGLYQEHYKTSRDYKFYVKHEMTEKQIFDFKSDRYSVDCVNDGWKIWQASAQRQGYKLVPVDPTDEMINAASNALFDHDACTIDIYKAMIGALNNE